MKLLGVQATNDGSETMWGAFGKEEGVGTGTNSLGYPHHKNNQMPSESQN